MTLTIFSTLPSKYYLNFRDGSCFLDSSIMTVSHNSIFQSLYFVHPFTMVQEISIQVLMEWRNGRHEQTENLGSCSFCFLNGKVRELEKLIILILCIWVGGKVITYSWNRWAITYKQKRRQRYYIQLTREVDLDNLSGGSPVDRGCQLKVPRV